MRAEFSVMLKRFLRALIGVSVAYAVAAQGLLIALGGFAPVAQAQDVGPAFELCLHDSQDAPAQPPASTPDQSGCTHCLFCFTGAHQALVAGAPAAFHRVDLPPPQHWRAKARDRVLPPAPLQIPEVLRALRNSPVR